MCAIIQHKYSCFVAAYDLHKLMCYVYNINNINAVKTKIKILFLLFL